MRGPVLHVVSYVVATFALHTAAPTASAADLAKANADILKASSEARALEPQIESVLAKLNSDQQSAFRHLSDSRLNEAIAEVETRLKAVPKEKVPAGFIEKLASMKAELASLRQLDERLASEWSGVLEKSHKASRTVSAHYEKLESEARRLSSDASAVKAVSSSIQELEKAVEPITEALKVVQAGLVTQSAAVARFEKSIREFEEKVAALAEISAAEERIQKERDAAFLSFGASCVAAAATFGAAAGLNAGAIVEMRKLEAHIKVNQEARRKLIERLRAAIAAISG